MEFVSRHGCRFFIKFCRITILVMLRVGALITLSSLGHASIRGPLRLAIKFVEFAKPGGRPVLTAEQARLVLAQVNVIYSSCGIHFALEQYEVEVPERDGLEFGLSTMSELDLIRERFKDGNRLEIVNTGPWDHTRVGKPNAWTAMPAEGPLGAVIEAPVASYAPIVAHELGHYLNLSHVEDVANLMNPVIQPRSVGISELQCETMWETAQTQLTTAIR